VLVVQALQELALQAFLHAAAHEQLELAVLLLQELAPQSAAAAGAAAAAAACPSLLHS
jgi:hypothetical protein